MSVLLLPVQVTPLPVYPVLQVQVKLSGKLMQVANSLHPPLLLAHSSTSVTSVHYTIDLQHLSVLSRR